MGQVTGINGIAKTSYLNIKQILVAPENAISLPVIVGNAGIEAGADGKKVLKAGTPLYGDLTARGNAFVKATTSGTPAASNAVGVILHDTDVTAGTSNAQIVIFGVVDVSKLSTAPTAEEKAALNGKITYIA